jgi:hypothetical protein
MNHVEEIGLDDLFDLDVLPVLDVPTFPSIEAGTSSTTACIFTVIAESENPYIGVPGYGQSPLGLYTKSKYESGEAHLEKYINALNEKDVPAYWFWLHPFDALAWSEADGRELKQSGRVFNWAPGKEGTYGGNEFGNVSPAFAFTLKYGVIPAMITMAGANVATGIGSLFVDDATGRMKFLDVGTCWYDTAARVHYQREGFEAAADAIGHPSPDGSPNPVGRR